MVPAVDLRHGWAHATVGCEVTCVDAAQVVVVLLTHNEELHIERALASVTPYASVLVVDSFSTDRTRELAAQFGPGVAIVTHKFSGYGPQRAWAIQEARERWSAPWLLLLDADEMLSGA